MLQFFQFYVSIFSSSEKINTHETNMLKSLILIEITYSEQHVTKLIK